MGMKQLDGLKKQTQQLSRTEKLELIAYLVDDLRLGTTTLTPGRKWHEIAGLVPHPYLGEDAQSWVSRVRYQDQEHREKLLTNE